MLTGALVLVAALSAQDPDTPPARIDDVVVTARWRDERLQDAPVSATVLTGADLRSRNLADLSQIDAFVPNLVFDPGTGDTGGSTNAQIFIRGVGQADFLSTAEPGVGIYVDGVYVARAIGSMMGLVDVEQVEVLRGPQGTAFGKNSVGGAISLTTRRPAGTFGGRAAVTLGSLDRRNLSLVVDVPLVDDRLLGKVVAYSDRRDGFVTRPDGGTLGAIDASGLGVQLEWRPDPGFTLRLAADYARRRDTVAPAGLVAVDPAAPLLALWNALVGAPRGVAYDARFVPTDPDVTLGTGGNASDLDQGGLAATAEWRGSAGTLRSITAYRRHDAAFDSDPDHSPLVYFEQGVTDRMDQFSQEVQWIGSALDGRVAYVVGGLYFSEQGDDTYRIRIAPGLFEALEAFPAGLIPGLGGAGNPVHVALDLDGRVVGAVDSRSHAVFAHADVRLTERLSLSAGLRQTWDRKAYRARFDRLASGVTAYDVASSRDWQALTPGVVARYRWSPRVMAYLSVARGYKSGGFNGRSQTAFEARTPFDPEYVLSYEAGVKFGAFDDRLAVNLALFRGDYTDLQLFRLSAAGGAPVVIIDNAGAARIDGFELEVTARPVPDLRLDLGVGRLDGRYERLDPTVAGLTLADDLPKTPEWSVNLGIEQGLDVALGRLTARADYAYRSRVRNTPDNAPLVAQPGHGLVNAGLTFQPGRGDWSVTVFGTNLADQRYITNGLDGRASIGLADVTFGRPREWGVRLDHVF
ncbi:TonB-dependent receptor [uncultured Brevundimonas sp.]|uniref:TonB-dependent receptor n=1 Tax=uncultured Brevundimonas sp. TaxID=213418 RepID=UPI0026175B59|nr:TonB-dependent receptor [uncultured Brevundimonas sp.]